MSTKRILRSLALLLLPVMLYYCVFLAFEPNNYFGLQKTTRSGEVLGMLRGFERAPQTSVIVGDSRMAHLNPALVEEAAGRPFGNIAYGGATLKENLDILEWWLERYPNIDEVVFEFTFYTANAAYGADRFATIRQSLENPFAYLTSLSFNLQMLLDLKTRLTGGTVGGGEAETRDPATYTYTQLADPATGEMLPLREDIAAYLELVTPYLAQWTLNEEQVNRLLETIAACTERGIRFVVVLPPVHPATRQFLLQPLGIDEAMQGVLARLHASGALVLDYEFTNPPGYPDDFYFDGLHLDYERGLPVWTRDVFTAIGAAPATGE